jgi:hypothetical protein
MKKEIGGGTDHHFPAPTKGEIGWVPHLPDERWSQVVDFKRIRVPFPVKKVPSPVKTDTCRQLWLSPR